MKGFLENLFYRQYHRIPKSLNLQNLKALISFFLIITFSSLLFAQQNQHYKVDGTDIYTKAKLIKGVPASLEKIKFFSPVDSVFYAVTYSNEADNVYFISRKVENNSSNYYLVLTSDGILRNYATLKLRNINSDKFFGKATVKGPNGETFTDKIYYLPKDSVILYKQATERNLPTSISSSISKFGSKYKMDFELTLSNEMLFMITNIYVYKTNSTQNTLEIGFPPLNFNISAGLRFFEYYKLDFRFGISYFYEFFHGFDKGVFLQADLFKTNLYNTVGIDFFNNRESGQNGSYSGGEFTLYCLGLGYEITKKFNVDITYCIPNKKVYGYNINIFPFYDKKYDKVVNGLIRLGFRYSLIF